MNNNNIEQSAHNNLEAVQIGIDSFKLYAEQLTDFDNKTRAAFARLGETQRDQNYQEFEGYFIPFWNRVKNWIEEVNNYEEWLADQKKIMENYITAGRIK